MLGVVLNYVAIRDAFDATRRQLQDYTRKRCGDIKSHVVPQSGSIASLPAGDDSGGIQVTDGQDIYFYRNTIVGDDFDSPVIGKEEGSPEETGDGGHQSTSV